MEYLWLIVVGVIAWKIYKAIRDAYRRAQPRASRYIPERTKAKVFLRDGGVCRHCGQGNTPTNRLEYDHVVPYSWGGTNDAANLQLLCSRCNHYKSNRYAG